MVCNVHRQRTNYIDPPFSHINTLVEYALIVGTMAIHHRSEIDFAFLWHFTVEIFSPKVLLSFRVFGQTPCLLVTYAVRLTQIAANH